mgnify:CR=1 FL=1
MTPRLQTYAPDMGDPDEDEDEDEDDEDDEDDEEEEDEEEEEEEWRVRPAAPCGDQAISKIGPSLDFPPGYSYTWPDFQLSVTPLP